MKKIEAIIRPSRLPALTLALHKMEDLAGVTISEARGFGCNRTPKANQAIVQDLIDYVPYIRIEVVCPDELASCIVLTIEQAALTGKPGDGKIFVSEVVQAVRIATGDRGASAVTRQAPQILENS